MKKALLCGYFGFGNMGDEAILSSAIKLLEGYGITPTVMFNPRGDFEEYANLGARYCNRFSVREIKSALKDSDALIFSGGNLFQNVTSNRSLLYYSAIAALAKREGKDIYMISGGIGELRGRVSPSVLRRALAGLRYAGMRTGADAETARSLLSCSVSEMPDLTFAAETLEREKSEYFVIIPRRSPGRLLPHAKRLKNLGLEPLIIPFFIDEDRRAAENMGMELGCEVLFSQKKDEILERISTARITVTERLHGAIFSLLASTPFLVESEMSKCLRFAEDTDRLAGTIGTQSPIIKAEELYSGRSRRGKTDFKRLNLRFKEKLLFETERLFSGGI